MNSVQYFTVHCSLYTVHCYLRPFCGFLAILIFESYEFDKSVNRLPMARLLLLLFFAVFSCSNSFPETLQPVTITRQFGAEDGLNSKTVYSIIQDKQGFIWFATDAGVYRYDGNQFKRYTVDNGISDNEILRLYEDKKGRIWFLTYNGYLSFCLNGVIYNYENTPFLKNTYLGASIVDAVEEEDDKIWFCAFKKGYISLKDTVVEKILLPPKERINSFPYLTKTSDGAIWYFNDNKMINSRSGESLLLPKDVLACCVKNTMVDELVFTSKGVFEINDAKLKPYIIDKSLPDFTKVITMFYEKESENVWLCSLGKGCRLFHNKKYVKTYLPNTSVTGVLRDREGNLWMGTMNEGAYVFYKSNTFVLNYDKSSGLSDNKVFSIALDKNNAAWLGYYDGSIDRLSGRDKTTFKVKTWNYSDYLRTMSIVAVGDTIWCASDGGIYYIAGKAVTKVPYPTRDAFINNYSVKHIIADEKGEIYGCFGFNYLKVEKDPLGYFASPVFDTLIRVFSSVKSASGLFYISSITGLLEYSPGNYINAVKTDIDFSHLRILDLKLYHDNELILATNSEGIFILKNNRVIQHLTKSEGLSDNNCRRLFLRENILYVCTGNGLNIFSKKNGKWEFVDMLNKRNGLLGNSVNDVTVTDSLIYVATDDGLSIVNKQGYLSSFYNSNIIITEVMMDTTYKVASDVISFGANVRRFLIKFSHPVYNQYNKLKVKYRLRKDNEKGDWIPTGNNEVEFSSLNPGSYLFEIKPDIETPDNKLTTLKIDVLPMWWQTGIARIVFVLLLLVTISIIVKQWTKVQYDKRLRLLQQKGIIEAERNRIASDMHDDIGADLTQISIWSNVLKSNGSNSCEIIEKISSMSNEVLSKMDQIIWALNTIQNQSTDLIAYLHSYAEEYLDNNDIMLEFIMQEGIPDVSMSVFQRRNIFLVVKELLHNTVKHGNASKVRISIFNAEGHLMIEYCDNGKGFVVDGNSNGFGLRTMVKRMEEIDSEIRLKSENGEGMHAYINVVISEQIFNS